jgi:hypothetical protein
MYISGGNESERIVFKPVHYELIKTHSVPFLNRSIKYRLNKQSFSTLGLYLMFGLYIGFQFIQCSVLTGLTVAKEASIVGSVTLSRNVNLGIDTPSMCLSCMYIYELIKFPAFSVYTYQLVVCYYYTSHNRDEGGGVLLLYLPQQRRRGGYHYYTSHNRDEGEGIKNVDIELSTQHISVITLSGSLYSILVSKCLLSRQSCLETHFHYMLHACVLGNDKSVVYENEVIVTLTFNIKVVVGHCSVMYKMKLQTYFDLKCPGQMRIFTGMHYFDIYVAYCPERNLFWCFLIL